MNYQSNSCPTPGNAILLKLENLPEKQSFERKYSNFKNTKFPRGNFWNKQS